MSDSRQLTFWSAAPRASRSASPESGSGWTIPVEDWPCRISDWFATVAQALKGVTLMAYCRDSQAEVRRSVDWEVDNFKGEVRIGLNLHERPGAKNECHTWTSNQHLLSVAEQLEAHHGPSVGIDLQSFTRLLEDYQDRR